MTSRSLLLAHEGVGAGVERAQLAGSILGAGEEHARVAAQRRVEADLRMTVAPSMPGSTPSTRTASGRSGGHAQAFLAARREQDAVAGALERAAELLAEGRAVVDDEDRGARCGRQLSAPARSSRARATT